MPKLLSKRRITAGPLAKGDQLDDVSWKTCFPGGGASESHSSEEKSTGSTEGQPADRAALRGFERRMPNKAHRVGVLGETPSPPQVALSRKKVWFAGRGKSSKYNQQTNTVKTWIAAVVSPGKKKREKKSKRPPTRRRSLESLSGTRFNGEKPQLARPESKFFLQTQHVVRGPVLFGGLHVQRGGGGGGSRVEAVRCHQGIGTWGPREQPRHKGWEEVKKWLKKGRWGKSRGLGKKVPFRKLTQSAPESEASRKCLTIQRKNKYITSEKTSRWGKWRESRNVTIRKARRRHSARKIGAKWRLGAGRGGK